MARIGVTYDQVELAAEKVLASGENPTIERVRIVLGGTGSHSTIAKHLSGWKNLRLKAIDSPLMLSPPDPVNKAVLQVWKQIDSEINKKEAAAEAKVKQICQKNQQLEQEKSVLEQSLAQTNAILMKAQAELVRIKAEVEKYKQDCQKATQKNRSAEKLLTELKKYSEKKLKALTVANNHRIQDFKKQLDDLKADRLREIQSLKDSLSLAKKDFHQTVQNEKKIINQLEKKRHRLMKQEKGYLMKIAELKQCVDLLSKQNKLATKQSNQKENKLRMLERKLGGQKAQITQLNKRLKRQKKS